MASLSSKARPFVSHINPPLCTRNHQIAALILVVTTFFFTRLFDASFAPCASRFSNQNVGLYENLAFQDDGLLRWPERGYASLLSLKIYVYEEDEIDGLKNLMYGRDGKITAASCSKGQWGHSVENRQVASEIKISDKK